jgi:hypothetical protein
MAISHQVSPASVPDVSADYYQRSLLDESGMIGTQMGTHNRSEMVAVLGMPCVIPPYNSNSLSNSTTPYIVHIVFPR